MTGADNFYSGMGSISGESAAFRRFRSSVINRKHPEADRKPISKCGIKAVILKKYLYKLDVSRWHIRDSFYRPLGVRKGEPNPGTRNKYMSPDLNKSVQTRRKSLVCKGRNLQTEKWKIAGQFTCEHGVSAS